LPVSLDEVLKHRFVAERLSADPMVNREVWVADHKKLRLLVGFVELSQPR
jgi:hypothetical protein